MKLKIAILLSATFIGAFACKPTALLTSSKDITVTRCSVQTVYGGTEDAGVSQTIVVEFKRNDDETVLDSLAYRGNVTAVQFNRTTTRLTGHFSQQMLPKQHPILGEKSAIHYSKGAKTYWLEIDSVLVSQPVYMPQMQHGE